VRVSPNTLTEVLCGAKVRDIVTDAANAVACTDCTDTIALAGDKSCR
jgi:hypothetical protein